MPLSDAIEGRERQIADLVTASFTASDGTGEGALVGGLVRNQMASTPPQDLHIVLAEEDGALLGVAVFTRLRHAADPRRVFLLSPLAMATDRARASAKRCCATRCARCTKTASTWL